MNLDQILASLGGASALWGPFGLLLLCGLGLPIPEDIVLVAAGFLGAENGIPFLRVSALMYFGILFGDSIVFLIGRHFGRRVLHTKLGSYLLRKESLAKAEDAFFKYGRWVIFVGRFLPGLRAPIFFSAGLLRFSMIKFWVMDGFAALVSAPLFVWLGHWAWERYANDLQLLEKTIGKTKFYFFVAIVLIGLGVFFYYRSRTKRSLLEAAKKAAASKPSESVT